MVIFLRRLFRTVSWWILGEVMRPETLGFYGKKHGAYPVYPTKNVD
jgi:hypothetical protein